MPRCTAEIYTLSLHDALPILVSPGTRLIASELNATKRPSPLIVGCSDPRSASPPVLVVLIRVVVPAAISRRNTRSEEHTSELQSLRHLVCRLLLEKKKYTMLV